jgi:3-hydroxybutyrate dehydrogenase
VLVNNAGIQFVSPIEEFPVEKWDQIIAINLSAAFHAIRAAVPGMKKRKWGRIISTASAHALVASPFKSAYVSAKHGIAGLTKTVALEPPPSASPQRHLPRLCLDPAGGKADSRHHEGARA